MRAFTCSCWRAWCLREVFLTCFSAQKFNKCVWFRGQSQKNLSAIRPQQKHSICFDGGPPHGFGPWIAKDTFLNCRVDTLDRKRIEQTVYYSMDMCHVTKRAAAKGPNRLAKSCKSLAMVCRQHIRSSQLDSATTVLCDDLFHVLWLYCVSQREM